MKSMYTHMGHMDICCEYDWIPHLETFYFLFFLIMIPNNIYKSKPLINSKIRKNVIICIELYFSY